MKKKSTTNIRWTVSAFGDLEDALVFLQQERPSAAGKFSLALEETVKHLETFPNLGRPGRVSGTREFVMADWPFLIPYRFHAGNLEILRIYHCSRRWPPK